MSAPRVVSVVAESPAQRAGLSVGDEIVAIEGRVPRDVIEYRLLVDEADPELLVLRGHEELTLAVTKGAGELLGAEVSSAVFDRVRTCDNHCEFCFIYQLPKGLRRSLYVKDDDYRLSFLYGNFTTLTRFTELDLERVLTERLSPLFVSIHATDPAVRAHMLRNPRGGVSLRWLRLLLAGGIEVHGQIVVCPGVNDGEVLEQTLAGILDEYPCLATVACVPLGVSRFSTEDAMRPHDPEEATAVIDAVEEWQAIFADALGRQVVFAADEYYLLAGRTFPGVDTYEGLPQHENGVGMAAAVAAAFNGQDRLAHGVRPGFFAWVDGAPAIGYRAPRELPVGLTTADRSSSWSATAHPHSGPNCDSQLGRSGDTGDRERPGTVSDAPVTVITGEYGARVLSPLLERWTAHGQVTVLPVRNDFFGGNIAVAGLLTGEDVARALDGRPVEQRYLLPDACLSQGRFLDGLSVADLPRAVEIVPADGRSLRRALTGRSDAQVRPRQGVPTTVVDRNVK
jgi:putative radical SAM enzyme (TIGR03279 family)